MSITKEQESRLKDILGKGFMTCNSYDSGYSVNISLKTLDDAHRLHTVLLSIIHENPELLNR